jgi:hypothetical protein
MRDYGKVHTGFWHNEELRGLDSDAKVLALYLLTSPHTTMIGAFRLPDAYACEDLDWTPERLRNCFRTLSGFAEYDPKTKWVWIVNFVRFNRPENPNQWKAAVKLAESIPDSVPFKEAALETVRKPFLNIPVPAPAPVPVKGVQGDGDVPPDCPHSEIIALYHEALPANPRIRQWTPARAEQLRARWREDEKRQSLDYWRRLFRHVAASPFLTGRKAGSGGRPFLPGLEWLVKSENFAKVIEGRYHDDEAMQ